MIQLQTPIDEFWHPKGDKDGNPYKVRIDQAEIACVRTDYAANTIELGIRYGYLENGAFMLHAVGAGAMRIDSISISDDDPKNPDAKAYSEFLDSVVAKGAQRRNFRVSDLEEFIQAKGLIRQ